MDSENQEYRIISEDEEAEDEEAEDSKKVHCRTNLSTLAKIYDAKGYVNRKEKQEICKKSVFFKLIGTMPKKKNNVEYFEQLADLYVIDKQAFLIKGRQLKLCPEEISYLTGLSNKGKAFVEGKSATLPTYFVDLCSRYGKTYSATAVSVKLISELLKEMVIETADDRVDFERLLNTMFTYVITARTQGRVPMGCMVFCGSLEAFNDINWPATISDNTHCFLKERQEAKQIGKPKKQVRCMVQVVEAWFNMRTSLFRAKDTPCSVDGDKLAPMLSYLGPHLSKSDVERRFEQIKPDEVLNCRDPRCSSQERLLDDGNVDSFSYKCSKYILGAVTDDFIGAYIKELLTQSMCRLSICDDVDKHFHSLKQEFNATDNFNLWQALTSKGEKILQGDALEEEETHSEADTSMINQDEDDAPKKTGEMSKSAKANLEGSSSQTEVPPKRQKYERLAQDEHDAPNKTGQTAIAGSSKMRVGKEGGVLGDARKSAKANLEKKKRRARVDYGEELVNCRIQVWWPMDKKFYAGTVTAFYPKTKKHKVLYDDNELETLNLRKEKWDLLGDDEKGIADNSSHCV